MRVGNVGKLSLVLALGLAAAPNYFAAGQGSVQAAEKGKKKDKGGDGAIMGTVSITKDDKGAVSAIKLTTADGTVYTVALDEQGKKLADWDGKSVTAKGAISDAAGQKTLTVTSAEEGSMKKKRKKDK